MNIIFIFTITAIIVDFGDTTDLVITSLDLILSRIASISQDVRTLRLQLQDNNLDTQLNSIVAYLQVISNVTVESGQSARNRSRIDGNNLNITSFDQIPTFNSTMQSRSGDKIDVNRQRRVSLLMMLNSNERFSFIQAHCFNEQCTDLCFHMAANSGRCAYQLVRTVPDTIEVDFRPSHFEPRYVGHCCGRDEFVNEPCFTYTPQAGGPAVNCHAHESQHSQDHMYPIV